MPTDLVTMVTDNVAVSDVDCKGGSDGVSQLSALTAVADEG